MIKQSSKRDWPVILKEFEVSNLTAQEFCKERGVSNSAFYKAKTQYGVTRRNVPARINNNPKFIDITPVTTPNLNTQKITPTLRIASKDGLVLEVFL